MEALVEAPAQDLQTAEDQVAEASAAGLPAEGVAEALAGDPLGPPAVDIPDLLDQEVPLAVEEEVILRGGLRGRLLLLLLGEEEL